MQAGALITAFGVCADGCEFASLQGWRAGVRFERQVLIDAIEGSPQMQAGRCG